MQCLHFKMNELRNIVYFATFLIISVESARILVVIPTPSISHQVVFRPLTQELAKRGHEVIVITTDPVFPRGQSPTNLTEIDVHDVSYDTWRKNFMSTTTGNNNDLYVQLKAIFHLFSIIFDKQLQTDQVQRLIQDKEQRFDLIMLESAVRPSLSFSYIYKAPVIVLSSFGSLQIYNEAIGAATHPILYPTNLRQKIYNITIWEKVKELYNHYTFDNMIKSHEEVENAMLKRHFGPNIPPLTTLMNNIDMIFLNIHPIWERNRPVPPSVIFMGGIHQKPKKELPEDIKTYLDKSVNGVIYFSFGTNMNPSMLPAEKIQMLLNAFSKLPYNVLWKWDQDDLPGKSPNIRISKWFPQSDLLRHPNVKLFITQGGLQSTDEAVLAGVPLIGIPMLADQWYNVEQYVYHSIGMRLDMESLNEEQLINAINIVIENKSYRNNIVKFRTLMYDQPQKPLERAVWWTEHVIRHGGARHLRAPGANISWREYLELDLVFIILLSFLTLILITVFTLLYVIRKICHIFTLKLKLKSS